eukprot:gene14094-29986_t
MEFLNRFLPTQIMNDPGVSIDHASFSYRAGRVIYMLRWSIFILGIISMVSCAYVGFAGSNNFDNEGLIDPRSEAAMSAKHLNDRLVFPEYMIILMVSSPAGTTWTVDHPNFKAACKKLMAGLESLRVRAIISYVDHPEQIKLVSIDRTKMMMVGTIQKDEITDNNRIKSAISGTELDVKISGVQAYFNEIESSLMEGLEKAEIFTLPFVILLLFLTTGGVVAGLAPWIVCLATITWSLAIMQGIHYSFHLSNTVPNVITMFGLGL